MARPKKADVLLVMSHLERGGAQRVVVTLANAWAKRGRNVSILAFRGNDEDFAPFDSAVERLAVPLPVLPDRLRHPRSIWRILRWLLTFRRVVRQSGTSVVLSFLATTNVKTILACLGLPGVRLVISERNDPARQELKLRWAVLRKWLYRFADVVTANSRGALEVMRPYVPERKLAFVPNPPAVPSDAPRVPLSGRAPTILAVGRLVHQKAYDVLLEALGGLGEQLGDWRVVIVGGGLLEAELAAEAERLGLVGRVTWTSRQSDPFAFYRSADVFVLPSRYEGMPNALMEAMSEGLPPIVTDTQSGALEFVEHERNGLVVPAEDAGALAQAILRLIGNADLRARLGEAARERLSRHTLDCVLEQWEEVLQMPPRQSGSQGCPPQEGVGLRLGPRADKSEAKVGKPYA